MADLKFVDQHNMVACLEKSEENVEFHQIVDFLSTCSINYALTVSTTIYDSYIKQFWNTVTSKTVNSVKQIHDIVDDKAVVISESSVRSDLLFNDEDGITCLTNDEIFENLALIGYETTQTYSFPTKHTYFSKRLESERVQEKPNEPPPEGHTSGSGEGSMEYHFELTDNVPPTPYDSPLSGGGYKHSQLKGKTYEEIHELYERQQKRNQDFIPMDSEKEVQESGKRLKRVAGSYATQKSPKKPKVMKSVKNVTEEEAAEYEKEKEELRLSLKIISGDDSEVNYEPLSRRFPIVNWEYKLLGNVDAKDMYVYKLTRADGSSSYHGDMQAFLRRLDRQDLNDLYRLVQERFQDHPLEGHDLLLWGDLRMLFNPDEKDELWMNQLDWKLLKWKLHENCGVHILFIDGTPMEINMLVERKYPLIKELLEKVLNLQLEAEEERFKIDTTTTTPTAAKDKRK
ncbi:hypothetical protein Tco_1148064 [Tanacetum coccineum]